MANQPHTPKSFREFVEQIILSESTASLTAYAVESLLHVMRGNDALSEDLLRQWIAVMILSGKKVSTCKRYFGKLHAIWNDWSGGTSASDPFTATVSLFATLHDSAIRQTEHNLSLVRRLLAKDEKSADRLTINIFFYLLYNPQASISDVINLTFGNAPRFCPQLDEIISTADSSHGRKYVFDLRQGKSRPAEISRRIIAQLLQLLTAAGMRFDGGFCRESITSLWIAAALHAGIPFADIRACVRDLPHDCSVLSIIRPSDLSTPEKEAVISSIADTINSHSSRWYVMKLRQGVSVDDIKENIEEKLPGRLGSMTFFYPTRSEVRKEGRRRIVEEVPYLPDILFFKAQTNKVKSLFANIGDLAWCFRTTNSPDSDYAVISNRQMTVFQQCIGRFTPDIHMELVDSRQPLAKGRRVKIVGGIMAGYEGEILDIDGSPGNRVFYLSITDNRKARWTAHVDDLFIQPLP